MIPGIAGGGSATSAAPPLELQHTQLWSPAAVPLNPSNVS